MTLNEKQAALCANNRTDFSGLSAVILNCTLKRPDTESHTGPSLRKQDIQCPSSDDLGRLS